MTAEATLQEWTDRMKRMALRLGFHAVGVAPAAPPPRAEFLWEWLRRGYQGSMAYLARDPEQRQDPQRLLPGAQSVICVLHRYRTGELPPKAEEPSARGRVARYAWGRDYHRVVRKRLHRLARWIQEQAPEPVQYRVAVDSAPLLERGLAARAGLGWIGKNTLLLNRQEGSYFFLGEVITTARFCYDAPETDHCGSCRACLDACPTEAFPEPYVLDARRCISYLTIELRGPIPTELRSQIGDWIFGCDVCQEVCPWNRKAPYSDEPDYRPRAGLPMPALEELLALDEEAFRRRFQGTPLMRAKRSGLLRNAVVALGNTGDPSALPALRRALEDPDPLVRSHAAWAIGRIGGSEARRLLEERRSRETDPDVLCEVEETLRQLADDPAA